jgi:hypothetical protein
MGETFKQPKKPTWEIKAHGPTKPREKTRNRWGLDLPNEPLMLCKPVMLTCNGQLRMMFFFLHTNGSKSYRHDHMFLRCSFIIFFEKALYSESFPVEGFLLQLKAPPEEYPKNPQYISFSWDAESRKSLARVYIWSHIPLYSVAEKSESQSKFRNTGHSQAEHEEDWRRKRVVCFQWR